MREFDGDSNLLTEERPALESILPIAPDIAADRTSSHERRWNKEQLVSWIKQNRTAASAIGAALAILVVASAIVYRVLHKPMGPSDFATPVTVQTVVEQKIRPWSEYSGRLQAVNYAEIRPEVSGTIKEVRFEDGQTVKKGDVLFVIDPAPYKAAVSKAEAALASAKTNAEFARTEMSRAESLVKSQAIAQRVYDDRVNQSRMADAAVQSAQAELDRAQVDIDRAYVKAPFAGRVGRPELTVGNHVQDGSNAQILTTIVSKGGIYANIDVDEQTYLDSIRSNATGRDQERKVPVELTIQGDKARVYQGSIYSFDNHIDEMTGTIRARAKFANEDGALMPGMFVSIRVGSSGDQTALVVPERSIGTDQNKKYVYVAGPDNKVQYREVVLGKHVGNDRVVLKGINAGDRVITDGLQHVRPNATVAPQEASPSPAPTK